MLLSGEYSRAHFALMLATGAAAIGREVTLFATNQGCHALANDWSGLAGVAEDAVARQRGVAGFEELRQAAVQLNIAMIACEAGLRLVGLSEAALLPEVRIAGVVTFLAATKGAQIITL